MTEQLTILAWVLFGSSIVLSLWTAYERTFRMPQRANELAVAATAKAATKQEYADAVVEETKAKIDALKREHREELKRYKGVDAELAVLRKAAWNSGYERAPGEDPETHREVLVRRTDTSADD